MIIMIIIIFYYTYSRYILSNNGSYKYVYLKSDIYLDTLFTCYEFLLLKETFIIIFQIKPNGSQYSFVIIHFFCFIIINTTVVQIVLG